jgi:hypothetical protein
MCTIQIGGRASPLGLDAEIVADPNGATENARSLPDGLAAECKRSGSGVSALSACEAGICAQC